MATSAHATSQPVRSTPGLRAAVICILLAFAVLAVINFMPSPASEERAAEYFTPREIERGLQYSNERKGLTWCGIGLQLALLTSLVCTRGSRRLTDWFDRWTGRRWLLTLLLVGATYL